MPVILKPANAPVPGRAELERVRGAMVERARERVRLGYYDRADVTRALVEALLHELALS